MDNTGFFPQKFICAATEKNTYESFVPSPYFRKTFVPGAAGGRLLVTGLGFYRVWINGTEITTGLLAPYISNSDDLVYFDGYDLSAYLVPGETNVLGFQLGNGMQNAPGGEIWDFDEAPFRSAPKLSFALESGELAICSDESVKTAPSPLYFDDLRAGVRYDARREIPGWNLPGFDDSGWKNAVVCDAPKGEKRVCEAPPVLPVRELKPADIRPGSLAAYEPRGDVPPVTVPEDADDGREGFLYDFGQNNAGVVRLKINGTPGQRVVLQFGELADDGVLDYHNICFYPDGFSQRDVYICWGGEETFVPPFTYHGFRYCLVMGITEQQATPELLTYIVCTSAPGETGSFACSDETANTLYRMCDASDRSNFYYFPTDCPHREKNGWTGDAALSAEHMLMTMDVGASYREWLRNIRAAQREDGAIPGIVPTGGWGFQWGNGPAWDAALIWIPYYSYRFTGDRAILEENADAIGRYLRYAAGKRMENGLVKYGLGDWCPIGGKVKPTLEFTDSVTTLATAERAAFIFGVLGLEDEKAYAEKLAGEFRTAIRREKLDPDTLTADTGCQTAQAMALYYGVFDPGEKKRAEKALIDMIHDGNDFMDVGILGARALFHGLSDAGESELAYKMITRPEFPSYGAFIRFGETTVPECFELPGEGLYSHDHHMYCDIKGWFISRVAGLRYNPDGTAHDRVRVEPSFIKALDFAEARYDSPLGGISLRWERSGGETLLEFKAPDTVEYELVLPDRPASVGRGGFRTAVND